jgi:hypothetical protein
MISTMKKPYFSLVGAVIALTIAQLNAAVPLMTSYQGRVQVGGANFTGNGQFKFVLIARPSGASLWSNDGTSANGSEPAAAVTLAVSEGLFTVLLGDSTLPNMQALTANIFTANSDVALRIWFNDGVNGSIQLAPDTRLGSVPYAISANIPDASITGAHLAPSTIDPGKLFSANLPQAGYVLSYDGAGFNWLDLSVANTAWLVNGASLYYNGGNVGIGSAAPTATLHVQSTRATAADNTVFLYNPSLGPNASHIHYGTNGDWIIRSAKGDGRVILQDLGANARVGIGTATPTTKLHVRGSLTLDNSADPGLFTGTGNAEFNRYLDLLNSTEFPSASGLKAGGVLVSDSYDYANPGKNDLIVKGSVGIGTPTPSRRLTVRTSGFFEPYGIEHTDDNVRLSTYLSSSAGWFGTVSDHSLYFYVGDGGAAMTIDTFENVGIGRTSPGAKLDVNGNINYGLLTKLDVADNFVSIIRAADLFFGHSSRRGAPGRALVDFGSDLHLNFAGDWANTVIGGANVSVASLTIRGGADVAEPFEMPEAIAKGAVVVIDEEQPGKLKLSTRAYDTRVAGIVSGANGVNPGIALHQEGVLDKGQNVALSGRVYVQADAGRGAIKPGDLLTTSDTPGHAMKVLDHTKAQGAILGKAMTGLANAKGMVLVLVTLQ